MTSNQKHEKFHFTHSRYINQMEERLMQAFVLKLVLWGNLDIESATKSVSAFQGGGLRLCLRIGWLHRLWPCWG